VTGHIVRMAGMGLLVAVAAPALLVVLLRVVPRLDRWTVPAVVALPGFVGLHAVVTVSLGHGAGQAWVDVAVHLGLLVGALLFWAPVLGVRHRLPEAGRIVYLYVGMPLLDLAGVWLVSVGDSAGGLAMIVGMLPMGLAAAALTWSWINGEERRAVLDEAVARGRSDQRGRATW
jgi:cytochrome c oxidase assembly factor CtaG